MDMAAVPENLLYTAEHEWILIEDGVGTVGITDHAQESLGDVTFVELPEIGASFEKGEVFGVVESVKAASDLYLPLGGEIAEVNSELEDSPDMLNFDPYGNAWIVKVRLSDPDSREGLLTPEQYKELN